MESSTASGIRAPASPREVENAGFGEGVPATQRGPTAPGGEKEGGSSDHFLAGIQTGSEAPSLVRGRKKVEDEGVRRALVRHLAAHSHTTERLTLWIAAALTVGLQGIFPARVVVLWMAGVVAAVGLRSWVRHRLRVTNASPERFLRTFRWTLVPVGLAWASGPLAVANTLDTEQTAVVLVIYAGLVGAATASLAPDRRSFTLFVVSLMGPACLAIGMSGWTSTNRVLIALAVLFSVAMHVLLNRAHDTLFTAVRTQEALRHSQRTNQSERALLDSLIRSAATAIVAVDSTGCILGVNPAFEALFGWRSTEALGRELDSLVVGADQALEAADLSAAVARGQTVNREVVRRHKDGTSIPVRVSAARSQDALVDAVFVLYEDRTAAVRAHAALTQAEEHYRDLVESSLDLVWKVDISGRWTFLNAASSEIYGAPPGDLLGTGFGDRVVEERRSSDLAALLSLFEGHALTDYESVHLDVNGTPRHLSFTGRPIRDASGAIVGAQGTARDVSARASVRKALEQARELALHNASDKTAFLANTSHEIRTPLNALIGMIEILLSSDLNAEQRRNGEVIRSSAGALLSLIDDILDFSKLDSENLELETIPYSVRGLIESTTRVLALQASKKGLELSYDVDPSVPDRVVGDPGRLRQVLMNLLGNAIKFTHEGSVKITVDAPVDSAPDGAAKLVFTVRDTGIGVPPDKIESIFDHFTQADPSTTRRYGGTGLGLAICKGFVSAMNGEISAQSLLGVGSDFTVRIPLLIGPALEIPTPATPRLSGSRALVVEADPEDRSDVEALLLPLEISLTFVRTAQEALERLGEQKRAPDFDFVLLDRAVSGMDGFELAERLREAHPAQATPIIMLSSEPRIGEGARCRALGIDGYLPKPVNRGDLLEIIGRVLSRDETADTQDDLVTRHSIAEARRQLNILLVEDNPLNQEVASALLGRRGHSVEVVDCGTDAVQAVLKGAYDVVLMDIQLPGIDGVEATRRIRSTSVGKDLPIVALTAHAIGEERDRAMAAGMDDFLTKPFRPHELFAVVEGWLPSPLRTDAEDPVLEVAVDTQIEPTHAPTLAEAHGPPVDVAGFRAEMAEVGIESVVNESLALFQATAPDRIRALLVAGVSGDLETAGREAHTFKSAAGIIRATTLHALLDEIEDAAKEGNTEAVKQLANQAESACTDALEYLDTQLIEAGSA